MRFDSTAPRRDKYELARERVASGDWRVDAEAGVVYGSRGKTVGTVGRYGYVNIGHWVGYKIQVNVLAHRVVWEAVNGPIPDGMQINHINGNKADNRIANLELVTASENVQHAVRTGLTPKAKLRAEDVPVIRGRLRGGERPASIAADYGVNSDTIACIGYGTRWNKVVPVAEGEDPRILELPYHSIQVKAKCVERVRAGESRHAVAASVGVSHVTVWRWMKALLPDKQGSNRDAAQAAA